MKKPMIAAFAAMAVGCAVAGRTAVEIVAAATATNYAGRVEIGKSLTLAEWRAYFDHVVAVATTNRLAGNELARFPLSCADALNYHESARSLLEEYDTKFTNAGIGAPLQGTNDVAVSRLRKTMEFCRKSPSFNLVDVSAAERANLYMEMHLWSDCAVGYEKVAELASKDMRRKMRDKGIVAGDSGNPIQEELDKLVDAFNAPRFAGVKKWFAKWYPEYTWIDSESMSDKEVAALKDDVAKGGTPFGVRVQNTLRFYLGVEEYNKFVQLYNGLGESNAKGRAENAQARADAAPVMEAKPILAEWYERFQAEPCSRAWWILRIAKERAERGESVEKLKEAFDATMRAWLDEEDDPEEDDFDEEEAESLVVSR